MKKITLLGLLLFSFISEAQVITHSNSLILANTNIACNSGGTTTPTSSDNRYFRFFNLSTFSITGDYSISSIQFGIQSLTIPTLPAGFPVIVKIYATAATNFPTSYPTGYTQIATVTSNILTSDVGTLKSIPIAATIPAGQNLLVEVGYEAQVAASLNRIFLSANDLGETAPTYISSTACSILNPSTMASIGFPGAHLVLTVTGAPLSTNKNELNQQVSVYPNPSNGLFSISLPSSIIIEKAALTDVSGKQIELKLNNDNNFDITNLNSGIYFLKIQTNEGAINKKIIKE